MKRVMLVDDERLPMQPYEKALKGRNIEVERFYEVDRVLEFACQQPRSIQAIVLDVMMPPGDAFKDRDVEKGHKTGILLYTELRKAYPLIPVIVLTHLNNAGILDSFPKTDPCLRILSKFQNPPLDFAADVEKLLGMLLTECTVARLDDDSGAVAYDDPRLGWVEMDIPRSELPEGVGEGSRLRIRLWFDDEGKIIQWQFPPEAIVTTENSDEQLITPPPKEFKDPIQMRDYLKRLGSDLGETE